MRNEGQWRKRMRDNEARDRMLLAAIDDLVTWHDANGRVIEASIAASSIRSRASLSRMRLRHWPSLRICSSTCAATWPIAVMAKTGIATEADSAMVGLVMIHDPVNATQRTPTIASSDAATVARFEPETTASSGIATSQIAAADCTPPVRLARHTTRPVRPADETACAIHSEPVRESRTAASTGRNRLAIARTSMPDGTPRHSR
ncbi:MAG: hypothetical protein EOO66_13375, partial [Methylobacterium sp.]